MLLRKVRPFFCLSSALWCFILFGIFVRIQELGYANLQGDEINPLDYVYENNFLHYILNQKRGPLQYLINFANTSLFGYINELQIRLPYLLFALAGFATLYLLTKKIFNKETALFTISLLSINGLFVAFSRIAQYQAFLFFALPLSGYLFLRYFEEKRRNLLYAAGAFYALSLLAHYDALSMTPFFVLLIAGKALKNRRELRNLLGDATVFAAIALTPNLLFYGAMKFNPYFKDVTSTYLKNRLLHGGLMPRLPDIMPIVSLYIPKHYLLTLIILLTIGLISLRENLSELSILGIKFNEIFIKTEYLFFCLVLGGATVFSYYPIKPRAATLLVCGSATAITALLFLSRKARPEIAALTAWTLFPLCIYFFLIRDPRTHVYTAFLPGFAVASYGVKTLLTRRGLKVLSSLFRISFAALLLFESAVIWQMFVDKMPEYPWWDKKLLGRTIYKIGRSRYQKVEGVFGVPYYRGWERLGNAVRRGCLRGGFYSNEKDSISYYYTRQHQVKREGAENLVLVEGPHSWNFIEESGFDRGKLEGSGYILIKTIASKHGLPVMYIWGKKTAYPQGAPDCDF